MNLFGLKVSDYKKYSFVLIGSGILVLFVSFVLFGFKSGIGINSETLDHFGSFIGGLVGALFSLAGVFLILQTLNDQDKDHQLNQIENRFYQLLNIHNENANNISIQDRQGRKVFVRLVAELEEVIKIVGSLVEEKKWNIDEEAIIDISYQIFFFGGVGELSETILFKRLNSYKGLRHQYLKILIYRLKLEQEKMMNQNSYWFYKPFEGHQSRLGHYYRHLYQTVQYIDSISVNTLSYRQKYSYIKSLRAQLSNHEQLLFFYNSLSRLGNDWERSSKLKPDDKMITKYNLIKNIPDFRVLGKEIRSYYPTVFYEGDNFDSEERKKWLSDTDLQP